MTVLRHLVVLAVAGALDAALAFAARHPALHRLTFAPGFDGARHVLGAWRAYRTAWRAARRVPAYARHAGAARPRLRGWRADLSALPPTDKAGYITRHPLPDLCLDGSLPRAGVVVDESSGSSGTPTSWVRGPAERRATGALLRLTFEREAAGFAGKPVMVLNAFSLGAWATGMNVSMALADATVLKSVGPDRDKVVATMRRFGPGHGYVVLGYPPFLKDLADDPRIDLSVYDVVAGYGGEGISENMRAYLLRSYRRVVGSYGASDLEINLAAETDLTVALRRELAANPALRAELTRTDLGVLPLVFQYDPLEYLVETDERGELLVTVCRGTNLSPRVRYDIHDLGHVARLRDVAPVLARHGAADLLRGRHLDLPLLFLYGRSDLSLDYYGAVVTPDAVRELLYEDAALAPQLRAFRLVGYEDVAAAPRLLLAVELRPGADPGDLDEARIGRQVLDRLAEVNGDFASARRIAAPGAAPVLRLFAAGEGPFAQGGGALKHQHVWRLDHPAAAALGLTAA